MSTPTVRRISECFVKPESSNHQICNLTPWDLLMLFTPYIHQCLLFKKPATLRDEHDFIQKLLEKLKHSLSLTLFHFYPLSGRLVTHKTQNPPSYTVSVDCNNSDGARFIHATLDMTMADILSPIDVPPIVPSFFDHNALNHDGHTMPLLSIQVTELVDGVIIGCSMNHVLADGTSYWNFFNTWSEIFQAQSKSENHEYDVIPISRQPIHDRWFPNNCKPPISLPFKNHDEFIKNSERPLLRLRFFHFSAESIAKLKAKANSESNSTEISSLQSLSALVWRSITRALSPPSEEKTTCRLAADCRSRMKPALAEEYFGNCLYAASAKATTRELLENGIGWAAWKLHVGVREINDRVVVKFLEWWIDSPLIGRMGHMDKYDMVIDNSPRFNMYGCEFGMGKAVAVRSGYANKYERQMTLYPGREGGGSIDLEVCLLPHTITALESDQEFMNAVTQFDPLLF